MEIIEATYRIVTPMFIGEANKNPDDQANKNPDDHLVPDTSDSVRPPSFRGALRFWWRALNWGRFRNNAQSDADALKALHREEVRLFGSATKTKNGKKAGGAGMFFDLNIPF